MAKNFQLALRPNRTLSNRKRSIQAVYVPRAVVSQAAMYMQNKGMQVMKRGYRTLTKYRKRESEKSTKKKLNKKKKSRKLTLRKNIMKLNGFRMYKGTVRGLRRNGGYVVSTDYGAGLTYCLTMQYIKGSSPTATTYDYSLNHLFPNGMNTTSTFTWCPYHPGGKFGWWQNNMNLTSPTTTVESMFANYASMHTPGIHITNNNFTNTTGPCNDNVEVHAPYSVAREGIITSAYYYTILGYSNRITVRNCSIDRPVVLHVVQIKFKSKCIAVDNGGTAEFSDRDSYFSYMTTGTSPSRTVQFREAVTADMKRGKINKKFVRTISHKSMVLGESTAIPDKVQYPNRRTFTIAGKCAIKRSRTCASSSAENEYFNAEEQLDEAYQRDTYYMMYLTPYDVDSQVPNEGTQDIDVQFEVDKTVLFNLPANNLN